MNRDRARPGSVAGAILLCLACDQGPAVPAPTLDLPRRPADAPGGSAVARDLRGLDLEAREERILAEIARGNVPDRLRQLELVEMTVGTDDGPRHVTFWVTPDYLAVGSDTDNVLVPLSPRTARRLADLVGASLPTPAMVDAVWSSARIRLIPIRLRPTDERWTVRFFERHNRLVQVQAKQQGARPGMLLAGHKLDVVLLPPPLADSMEFGLYGWHLPDGQPVQPLFPVPPDRRPHFSVGVRLVHRSLRVDGVERELPAVLDDPTLAPLLHGGGTTERAP